MRIWEIDVDLRVRKTLLILCPGTEETARGIAALLMSGKFKNHEISPYLKWSDNRQLYRAMPVETIIDNAPQIVAVRDMSETEGAAITKATGEAG
jgi:hypothetical protein